MNYPFKNNVAAQLIGVARRLESLAAEVEAGVGEDRGQTQVGTQCDLVHAAAEVAEEPVVKREWAKPALRQLPNVHVLADYAQSKLEHRRARSRLFPDAYFGEPAWEILLDLFVERTRRRSSYVGAVCAGSSASATTTLRYLAMLEEDGMVLRSDCPTDKRRVILSLSDNAYLRVAKCLAEEFETGH